MPNSNITKIHDTPPYIRYDRSQHTFLHASCGVVHPFLIRIQIIPTTCTSGNIPAPSYDYISNKAAPIFIAIRHSIWPLANTVCTELAHSNPSRMHLCNTVQLVRLSTSHQTEHYTHNSCHTRAQLPQHVGEDSNQCIGGVGCGSTLLVIYTSHFQRYIVFCWALPAVLIHAVTGECSKQDS